MVELSTDKKKHRAKIVEMLLADRKAALEARNSSAAVQASTRLADLLLKDDEDARVTKPINRVATVIFHQIICPVCKEVGPITDVPPIADAPTPHPGRAKSGWDDDEE